MNVVEKPLSAVRGAIGDGVHLVAQIHRKGRFFGLHDLPDDMPFEPLPAAVVPQVQIAASATSALWREIVAADTWRLLRRALAELARHGR
jgi:hypothetical protein